MINWKEIPFVRFFLPFALGISLSVFIENNHFMWYWILVLFIFIRLVLVVKKIPYRFRLVHGLVANVLLFLIGYLWCFHHNELQSPNHFQSLLQKENIVIGKISNTPEAGKYLKAQIAVQQFGNAADSLQSVDGNLLIYLKNDSLRNLNYGDVVIFKSRIQKVDGPKNPESFDYQAYLHFQNIHYQTFVNTPQDWKVIAQNQGNVIQKKAIKIRQYFLSILQNHLTSPHELAVGKALILGQKDNLDENVRLAYAQTGALHVLAVSGLHVGLVAWFVNILLSLIKSKTWTWRVGRTLILIGVVWSFALITGGSPSVLRASTMFTFLIIGLSVNRSTNIYNSLAISATFLLVWNPYLLFNVGFQLSYLAVIGIVFFQPKIFNTWYIKNSIGRATWRLATVSFGAQIGTIPISIYYFNLLPLFAWLSGIIVIPAATVILGSGLLLLVFETTITSLSFIPGNILLWTIWLMNQSVFLIQKIPWSVLVGISISLTVVILLYGMVGSVVMIFNQKNYRWLIPAAGFSLLVSINYSFTSFQEIHQRKITIYHSYKNTIIDFFDGKKGRSFSNENIDETNLSFATQNHRWGRGVRKMEQLHFDIADFENENSFYQKPFLHFFDKKILLIDDEFQFKDHSKIEVDFILIRKNPKINIEEIPKYFSFKKIIFDCSSSQWRIEKWKTTCENLNLPFYDVYEKGAFEFIF